MASIALRNLDDDLKTRLHLRAAGHGRSIEYEARLTLDHAVRRPVVSRDLASIVRTQLELPPRELAAKPPSFE